MKDKAMFIWHSWGWQHATQMFQLSRQKVKLCSHGSVAFSGQPIWSSRGVTGSPRGRCELLLTETSLGTKGCQFMSQESLRESGQRERQSNYFCPVVEHSFFLKKRSEWVTTLPFSMTLGCFQLHPLWPVNDKWTSCRVCCNRLEEHLED